MVINEMTLWLLGIAVLFTAVGYSWGKKGNAKKIVESTIDTLISDSYLKTRGTGKDIVVIKWREWENDKTD